MQQQQSAFGAFASASSAYAASIIQLARHHNRYVALRAEPEADYVTWLRDLRSETRELEAQLQPFAFGTAVPSPAPSLAPSTEAGLLGEEDYVTLLRNLHSQIRELAAQLDEPLPPSTVVPPPAPRARSRTPPRGRLTPTQPRKPPPPHLLCAAGLRAAGLLPGRLQHPGGPSRPGGPFGPPPCSTPATRGIL